MKIYRVSKNFPLRYVRGLFHQQSGLIATEFRVLDEINLTLRSSCLGKLVGRYAPKVIGPSERSIRSAKGRDESKRVNLKNRHSVGQSMTEQLLPVIHLTLGTLSQR